MGERTTYPAIVGAILVQARKKAGLTQVQLAQIMGINQPTISAIEHGTGALRVEQLARWAEAVGTTAGEVLGMADREVEALRARGASVQMGREWGRE